MNYYIWMCIFAVAAVQLVHGNNSEEPEVVASNPLIVENELNFKTNCSKPGLYCKSCNVLVMCVETEQGWAEQHVADCYNTSSCYVDHCISGHNILCDGTKDIPFKCHVPGIFPDPFDCQSYYMCVLTTETPEITTPYPTTTQPTTRNTEPITEKTTPKYTTSEYTTPVYTTDYPEVTTPGNNTITVLKGFKHTCPDDGWQKYGYDAKSTYCKHKLGLSGKCPTKLPVPVCQYAGESNALIENDSIYYICEKINNALYPNLYACPHGRKYINQRCIDESEIETTTSPWTYPTTTSPWTYQPTYTATQPDYPTTEEPDYPTTQRPDYPTTQRPDYPTTEAPDYPSTEAPDYPTTQRPDYPTTEAPDYPTTQRPDYPTSEASYTTGTPWLN